MLRIKLGERRYAGDTEADHPFLPRLHVGWDPTISEDEVYQAARGWWRLSRDAEKERWAIVLADNEIKMAIEISEWRHEQRPDGSTRRAFAGRILGPGEPMYDRFVGGPDPAGSTSRFPVLYMADLGDSGQCRCGCGLAVTRGEWVQGHDQRAIHNVIRADFGGSVSRFIDWYEANGPTATDE